MDEPNLLEDHRSPELLVSVVLGVLSAVFATGLGMYALEIVGAPPEDALSGALATAATATIAGPGKRWDYVPGGGAGVEPAWTCEQLQRYVSIVEEGSQKQQSILQLLGGFPNQESFALADCLEAGGAAPLYIAAATPRVRVWEVEDGWASIYAHLDGHFSVWKQANSDEQLRFLIALARSEGDGRLQAVGAPDPRCPELLESIGIVEGDPLEYLVARVQQFSTRGGVKPVAFEAMRCLEAIEAPAVLIAAASTEIRVTATKAGWRCAWDFEHTRFTGNNDDCSEDYMDALLQRSREEENFAQVFAEVRGSAR